MARSFGTETHEAEDLVQEMYLRMYKYVENPEKIMYNDKEVNTYFVFVVLRNLFFSSKKSLSSLMSLHIEELNDLDGEIENVNYEYEQAHKNLINELWDEVETWHWYDTKLFKLYHNTDMTIKKISQETKISERSIWNTLDNGRKKIKQKQEKSYKIYKKAKK
jgi:RNA polymerase sigma factor (sigma-70 family)